MEVNDRRGKGTVWKECCLILFLMVGFWFGVV